MPCTVAPIATTTNTPIATPAMVSVARTLLLRIDSNAIPMPSSDIRILSTIRMLIPAEVRQWDRDLRLDSRDRFQPQCQHRHRQTRLQKLTRARQQRAWELLLR